MALLQLDGSPETKILVRQYQSRLRAALAAGGTVPYAGCAFGDCENEGPFVEIPSQNGTPGKMLAVCEWHRSATLKGAERGRGLEAEELGAFLEQARVRPGWLVSGLIPEQGIMTWHGSERSMKSLTMLAVGYALAMGQDPFGLGRFRSQRAAKVLHVTEEDSRWVVGDRLKQLIAGWGQEQTAPPAPGWYTLLVRKGVTLDTSDGRDRLFELVLGLGVEVMFLEPIRTICTVAEGTAKEFAPVRDWLLRLQEETPCRAIVIGAHWRKTPSGSRPGTEGTDNERLAGAALKTASDGLVAFRKVAWNEHCMTPAGYKTDETPKEVIVQWQTEAQGEHGERFGDWVLPRYSGLNRETKAVEQKLGEVLQKIDDTPTGWASVNDLAGKSGRARSLLVSMLDRWVQEGKLVEMTGGRQARLFGRPSALRPDVVTPPTTTSTTSPPIGGTDVVT